MSWASRRRFIILSIVGIVAVAFFIVLSLTVFYKAPSCSDGIQNQSEAGIDCGGSCPYLCSDQANAPIVLFTKTISQNNGRTDVVVFVENANASTAAKDVPYTLSLYGADQVLVQEITGSIDLPPSSTVPIFIPNIASGSQKVASAFLSIAPSAPKWFTLTVDPRIVPIVSNTTLGGSVSSPRINAVLSNTSVTPITNIDVIVVVHDEQGEVIAASRTIVPFLPSQGQAIATFTWNSPFIRVPAKIEVIPVISLP